MSVTITSLAQADRQAVEALLDAAFGADRHQRTAYRIREGTTALPDMSFAAFDETALVGSLQSWPICIAGAALTLIGPVAVDPLVQRGGIGRALMTALMSAAGDSPMAMIGDPEYYGRFFGFSADVTAQWQVPGPVERHRLLARNAYGLPRSGMLGPHPFALAESKA